MILKEVSGKDDLLSKWNIKLEKSSNKPIDAQATNRGDSLSLLHILGSLLWSNNNLTVSVWPLLHTTNRGDL